MPNVDIYISIFSGTKHDYLKAAIWIFYDINAMNNSTAVCIFRPSPLFFLEFGFSVILWGFGGVYQLLWACQQQPGGKKRTQKLNVEKHTNQQCQIKFRGFKDTSYLGHLTDDSSVWLTAGGWNFDQLRLRRVGLTGQSQGENVWPGYLEKSGYAMCLENNLFRLIEATLCHF